MNLFFMPLQEEMHERPQITSMIGSLANYSNTIPSAPAEGADAKPAQPSARMGKSYFAYKTEINYFFCGSMERCLDEFCESHLCNIPKIYQLMPMKITSQGHSTKQNE